jgi:hypothetical protein
MSSGLYSGVSGLALGVGLYRGVSGLWSGASGLITGWGGAVSPSLNLNLLAGPLDSRITFSRGSNATMIDGTGRIVYAPANLLTYSQEFDNAAWTKSASGGATAPVVTANTTVAPDGTTTADTVVFVAPVSVDRSNITAAPPLTNGVTYIGSFYVKADGAGDVGKIIAFRHVGASGYTLVTLTAAWQRVSVAEVAAAGGSFSIDLRPSVGTSSGTVTVNLWGAQLEPVTYQTTPGTYNPTTATAYYGPRFDAFPVTCLPRGLLLEGARTNILTYSSDFANAAWTKTNATITANAVTAPDGTTTADTLVSSTSNTAKSISQSGLTSTIGTFTVYAKPAGETVISLWLTGASVGATFTLTGSGSTTNNGATSSAITPAGDGWYRCVVYYNAATTTAHIYLRTGSSYIGDGTSGAYIWGAQLEAGNFVSSYIPTGASTATRNADSAIMTGNNFSSWYTLQSGTLVVGAEPEFSSTTGKPSALLLQSGTPNYHALYVDGASGTLGYDVASSGVVMDFLASSYSYTPVPALQASLYSSVASQYAVYGQAVTYSNNFFANSANGGPATTDTSGAVPEGLTSMVLGQNDGEYGYGGWFGWLRGVQAYGAASSTATLNQLSDAAGASQRSLSLDFTGEMYYSGTVPFQTPPSFYVGFTVGAYVTED